MTRALKRSQNLLFVVTIGVVTATFNILSSYVTSRLHSPDVNYRRVSPPSDVGKTRLHEAANRVGTSWASFAKNNTSNSRYVFLLGNTDDQYMFQYVVEESAQFNDIVMGGFYDSFRNLTLKTIMAMKWMTSYCSGAQFFMKTDDDMWVNIPEVMKMLQSKGRLLQTNIAGACDLPTNPHRQSYSKWRISIQEYPHKSYPRYCSGTGYVTSFDVVKQIYDISPTVPFLYLEDVYVALCLQKLKMGVVSIPGFDFTRNSSDIEPCLLKSSTILTAHSIPTQMLQKIMETKCDVITYDSISQ